MMTNQLPVIRNGFSLVEISIVLVILATVISGLLPFLTESIRAEERDVTLERMEKIEEALLAYALDTNDLPCPADPSLPPEEANGDFGVQAQDMSVGSAAAGTCTDGAFPEILAGGGVVSGAVPVRSIHLPEEYAFDGWGRKFTYHVTQDVTSTYTDTGVLNVQNFRGDDLTTAGSFAIVSHGVSGHGAWTRGGGRVDPSGTAHVSEQNNCNCQDDMSNLATRNIVVQDSRKENGAAGAHQFDDLVRFMTPSQMRVRLGSL